MKILEVIVSSLADAREAEAGGADRLEVVRDLADGGLTPDFSLVSQICASVSIAIRVMVRESPSMSISSDAELNHLRERAAAFNRLPIDGLVLGFIEDGRVDTHSLSAVLAGAASSKCTFHRAFDDLSDPLQGIDVLKRIPQIDRILTAGGPGSWPSRQLRLHLWQRQAQPRIKIIAGAGLDPAVFDSLNSDEIIEEIHVGRAARNPPHTSGAVCRLRVAKLKGLSA